MDKKNLNMGECIFALEEMSMKIDFLAAIANTCGAAFEDEKSMSILNNESIQGSFYCINRQAEDISKELGTVIKKLIENENIITNHIENNNSKALIDEE